MTAADAAAAADLASQLGYPTTPDDIAVGLADIRRRTDDEVLVATDPDDRAIGWIHVGMVAALQARATAGIHGLVVDEAHRSSGIGAELVTAAEAWARSRGAVSITVRSRSTRRRAHRFYERLGYVEVKRSHVFERPLV